jgi:asparagine synthase (glutamine-hydrolysing)
MCGITACIGDLPPVPIQELSHRGPDEFSKFESSWLNVEFARLSITGGAQGQSPARSKSGRWLIFLNGEIYNFRELQTSHNLQSTQSDTQTIANGIESLGIDFLQHIRGMYVIFIIDSFSENLYIARDPLGEKPLFYTFIQNNLYFSSEFTPLLTVNPLSQKINLNAIGDFFRFGYIEEPKTMHCEIFALNRGGCYVFAKSSSKPTLVLELIGYNKTELELQLPQLLGVLASEVGRSDVKSALALSGGIDSSAALALFTTNKDFNVRPFIVDYPDFPEISEASEAFRFSLEMDLNPVKIEIRQSDVLRNFHDLITSNDQPNGDFAGINYFRIFQTAQELGFKVVHLGHGPDEFFWGYEWLNSEFKKRFVKKRFFSKKNDALFFWDTPAKSNLTSLLKIEGPSAEERIILMAPHDPFVKSNNDWTKLRSSISHSYLSTNGLRQSDRLAMRFSVEPRTLFADSRLYGWSQVNSVPNYESFNKMEFRRAVPESISAKKRVTEKIGFRTPLEKILMSSELFNEALTLAIKDPQFESQIDLRDFPMNFSDKHRLVVLDIWLRNYL